MEVILKLAVSLDGCTNDRSGRRLILSNEEDFDRLDEVRACSDAVLVGAATVRADNPKLVIRSSERRATRKNSGKAPDPIKVTVTCSGNLEHSAAFFQEGEGRKMVFCPRTIAADLKKRLHSLAEIFPVAGESVPLLDMMAILRKEGIGRLLIEGGSRTAAAFLEADLIDELELSVAPFFVGDPAAPRFLGVGKFRYDKDNRIKLIAVKQLGDMGLLSYRLRD
jgi:5-amino-6-(5-phosphoribosylamino)uracil reductase